MMREVICPYCNRNAELVDSIEVYSKSYGMIWLCRPCNAYVGVHKNSKDYKPLGKLANKELRLWRKRAHDLFDPLWRAKIKRDNCSKGEARNAGYSWLANQLDIRPHECHIAMFDIDSCKRVVDICSAIIFNKELSK